MQISAFSPRDLEAATDPLSLAIHSRLSGFNNSQSGCLLDPVLVNLGYIRRVDLGASKTLQTWPRLALAL
jgi:hypothetical protein